MGYAEKISKDLVVLKNQKWPTGICRPLFSGAYENNFLETIGIKNGVKLLILIEIHKNVFRAFPSD